MNEAFEKFLAENKLLKTHPNYKALLQKSFDAGVATAFIKIAKSEKAEEIVTKRESE